jgi:hypothetical protein
MKVEFTKELTSLSNGWRDMQIAINERADNLDSNNFSEEQQLLLEKVRSRPELIVRFREFELLLEMAAQTKKLWKPTENLAVYFFGGQDERTKRVMVYASIWSQHCGIKFSVTDKIEDAKLRVAFQAPSSWSYIGTDALGVPRNEPTINFGWLEDSLPEKDYKQVVLHEFGHALGLIHEHQSPTAIIQWNKPYVYWYFWQHHGWTRADVDRNLFQEFEKTSIRASALDKDSIMAYHIPTQFTFNNQVFQQSYVLSKMDEEYIGKLYPKLLLS